MTRGERSQAGMQSKTGGRATGVLLTAALACAGCAVIPYRFADREPTEHLGDTVGEAVPRQSHFNMNYYGVDACLRQPLVHALEGGRVDGSGDVNSMDQLVASSWYTPRLGYREISPDELLRGPENVGPPQLPVTVVRAKHGGNNPGFVVADARGFRYLIKFDPPDYPRVETTTALIVNRLFWGFGYNVPEDYLFFFRADELEVDSAGELSREEVDRVLSEVANPENGVYASTASLFIAGRILGGTPDRGVREGDGNDRIPHEDRRSLRALRVFGAFTNHVGMRPDNSLDVYVGEPGEGYVRHYLLDFGEALGGHGAGRGVLWNGFEHLFSFPDVLLNFCTLGLWIRPWERTDISKLKSDGPLEAEAFEPQTWKEITQYQPIRRSRPADDYWAAKIVGALKPQHVRALVEAARYPEPGAGDYVAYVLLKRRKKILDYFLYHVSPVENDSATSDSVYFRDMGRCLGATGSGEYAYRVRYFSDTNGEIAASQDIKPQGETFAVALNAGHLKKASGYVRMEVQLMGNGREPAPAQFHFREGRDGSPRLVGVIH